MATQSEIIAESIIIKNETTVGANTASRVGKNLEDLANKSRPYKIYEATLNQAGGAVAPTVIVHQNDLGTDITWSYSSVGIYIGTAVGLFSDTNTTVLFNNCYQTVPTTQSVAYQYLTDEIYVETRTLAGAVTDGELYQATLQIKIYE